MAVGSKAEIVSKGFDGLTLDFATGAMALGNDPTALGEGSAFDSIERVVGTAGDDLFLLAGGAQSVGTGGGADTVLYFGAGDVVQVTNGDARETLVTASFKDGGFAGVRLSHQEDVSNGGRYALFDGTLDTDSVYDLGASYPSGLFDVSIFDGTDGADVFYALGVYGNVSASEAPEFIYDGLALTGSLMFGGAGTDVFFAGEHSSLFDGGDAFDVVNFSLDAVIANDLSETVTRDLNVDLETGTATTTFGAGGRNPTHSLRDIEVIVGTSGKDTILGDGETNYLFAGPKGTSATSSTGAAATISSTRRGARPGYFRGAKATTRSCSLARTTGYSRAGPGSTRWNWTRCRVSGSTAFSRMAST